MLCFVLFGLVGIRLKKTRGNVSDVDDAAGIFFVS